MALEFILRHACIGVGKQQTVDIGIAGERIVEIAARIDADVPGKDLAGRLVIAGFVETHIHLDKSCILDRCHLREKTLALHAVRRLLTSASGKSLRERCADRPPGGAVVVS